MNIMLDTCALLWLAMGDARLSDFAKQAIDNAAFAFVSVISGFEITLKQRRGKLLLPAEPADWFNRIVTHHNLNVLALDLDDALRAPGLPDLHRDPCDRFIIAAALRLGVPVLTEDSVFADYGVRVIRLA
jgi:PIN domain nuclease of toxin-antitoxin system